MNNKRTKKKIRCKTITFIVVGFEIYTKKNPMKKKKEITIDSGTKANVINTASEKKEEQYKEWFKQYVD